METEKITNEKIEITINNTDKVLGWLEKMLNFLKEYGAWRIIKATFLIAFVSLVLYACFNFPSIIEYIDNKRREAHLEQMEERMKIAPKIQGVMDKLTFSVGATRVLLLELHNGNTGNGGLPFTKCSATYESLNIGKFSIAQEYQDVNMSLVPFLYKLHQVGYWCGNVETLEEIDRGLYYKVKGNGTEHFSACAIQGIEGNTIAFLIISYDKKPEDLKVHECEEVRVNMRHVASEIAVMLEVRRLTI